MRGRSYSVVGAILSNWHLALLAISALFIPVRSLPFYNHPHYSSRITTITPYSFHHRWDHRPTTSRNTNQLPFSSKIPCKLIIMKRAASTTTMIARLNEYDDSMTQGIPNEAQSCISQIESIISQDEGGRGIQPLVIPGDLLNAAVTLARLTTTTSTSTSLQPTVLILSGFPCCVQHTPPTETDGPPGAVALARASLALGYNVTLVTDECNEQVFREACRPLFPLHYSADPSASSSPSTAKEDKEALHSSFEMVAFPANLTVQDERLMNELVYGTGTDDTNRIHRAGCDLIIACERAGKANDGNCYTMRGVDMTSRGLVAPLDRIVELSRQTPQHANSLREGGGCSSGNDSTGKVVKFIGIGDGGNEMGMGKVIHTIKTEIDNGSLIGAVTSADYLIVASVSNWGGYALAAASAIVKYYDDEETRERNKKDEKKNMIDNEKVYSFHITLNEWVKSCVPTEEEEIALLNRCVAAGCRDGVSGNMEATVDGMPLETSLTCLRNIRNAAMG